MITTPINEPHVKVDRPQLAALAGLMLLGTLFVFSATMANASETLKPWYSQTWTHQIVWYALGIGAGTVLCLLDYHT
jgi:cell division protein FtsW (lipid II flippase)